MPKFVKGESGNAAGRPPGATSKIPSNKEIKDTFKSGNKAAFNRIMQLIASGNNDHALKAAVKILDINYEIVLEEEKNKSDKAKVAGRTEEHEPPKSNVKRLTIPRK